MADLREAGRARLAALEGHLSSIQEAEKRILQQAQQQVDAITEKLSQLRPRVLLDESAADEYTHLVEKRGRLNVVIAQARKHLGAD